MKEENIKLLHNILDAISVIEETLQGIGFNDFRTDRRKIITTVENFEIIIHSIKNLPESSKVEDAGIILKEIDESWTQMIIDEYVINEEEIWNTAKRKLNKLRKVISEFLV